MTRTFSYSFRELSVTRGDLEECIGGGSSLEIFSDRLEGVLKSAQDICNIRGGYRVLNEIDLDQETRLISAGGQKFSPGRIIFDQVKDSDGLLVFVCTAGEAISNLSRELTGNGDTLTAYLYDVTGSVCVEKAMDKLERELFEDMRSGSVGLTRRFSPGYCGWDVAEQQKLFSLLPEGFCGISLSASSLMKPIKSVSGIMGFGPGVVRKDRPCSICDQRDCLYYKKVSK